MPNFVFAYRTRTGYTPTADTFAAWSAWFQSMGDQVVDMGQPVVSDTGLGNVDVAGTRLGGYSVIRAEDLEAAVAIAKGCPTLDHDGGVEIGLLGEVPQPG